MISKIQPEQMPSVVFATAFDSFAVDAFNVHALDYLLKPIDPRRLEQSLDRIRGQLARTSENARASAEKGRLVAALSELPEGQRKILGRSPEFVEKKLSIRDGQQTLLIAYDDIDWIDAAGDYMCIHARVDSHHALYNETARGKAAGPSFCTHSSVYASQSDANTFGCVFGQG